MHAYQIGPSVSTTQAGTQQAVDIPALETLFTVTSTAISASTTDDSYNAAFSVIPENSIRSGDMISVAGFANGGNNGRKRVREVVYDRLALTSKILVEANLVTEAATPSVTLARIRLPDFVLLVTNDGDVLKYRPWGAALGTAPLAAAAALLPRSTDLVVNVAGCDQMLFDGAGGIVVMTSLGNGS